MGGACLPVRQAGDGPGEERRRVTASLIATQGLNGLQYGVILFLVAAGLTLVFGVMDFINLAHGVQYMLGAYLVARITAATGSFAAGFALGLAAAVLIGVALERVVFRPLLARNHLDQVLGTFGVILVVTEGMRLIFGPAPVASGIPDVFAGAVVLPGGLLYPLWRLVVLATGLLVALGLWWLVQKTRLGMLVRAGSTHPEIVAALGVPIDRLFRAVLAIGAGLAGLAGAMAGPLVSVEPTMGDSILILAFVVVVIGGIGSVRGALVAALMVGLVDTLGRAFAGDVLRQLIGPSAAATAAPAVASMLVYLLMALVLGLKPAGLFGRGA